MTDAKPHKEMKRLSANRYHKERDKVCSDFLAARDRGDEVVIVEAKKK